MVISRQALEEARLGMLLHRPGRTCGEPALPAQPARRGQPGCGRPGRPGCRLRGRPASARCPRTCATQSGCGWLLEAGRSAQAASGGHLLGTGTWKTPSARVQLRGRLGRRPPFAQARRECSLLPSTGPTCSHRRHCTPRAGGAGPIWNAAQLQPWRPASSDMIKAAALQQDRQTHRFPTVPASPDRLPGRCRMPTSLKRHSRRSTLFSHCVEC